MRVSFSKFSRAMSFINICLGMVGSTLSLAALGAFWRSGLEVPVTVWVALPCGLMALISGVVVIALEPRQERDRAARTPPPRDDLVNRRKAAAAAGMRDGDPGWPELDVSP